VGGVLRESVGLRTIVVCELATGLWLGALEVAAPAIAAENSAAELGAVPLAAFAAGSIAASLWSGTGRLQRTAAWRYLAGCITVAVALPLCLVVPTLIGITAVVVVAGAGFGLLNVALFELLDDVVAADRAVEAFTWLTTWQGAAWRPVPPEPGSSRVAASRTRCSSWPSPPCWRPLSRSPSGQRCGTRKVHPLTPRLRWPNRPVEPTPSSRQFALEPAGGSRHQLTRSGTAPTSASS
jgi:hypothetical protein